MRSGWLASIPNPSLLAKWRPATSWRRVSLRVFLLAIMTGCAVQAFRSFRPGAAGRRQAEAGGGGGARICGAAAAIAGSGRLAAEIAHQLKNPLGIINNAAFTLQRTVKEGKKITQQIQIIREEVERSDRILTELMGYAQLSEGKVEKMDVADELDRAIERVFPAGGEIRGHNNTGIMPRRCRRYCSNATTSPRCLSTFCRTPGKPWTQRAVACSTRYGDNYTVVLTASATRVQASAGETGPRSLIRITRRRRKGTGLGLAIVKHNTEIYGGTVQVESELGKGTSFTIALPAQTVMRLRK